MKGCKPPTPDFRVQRQTSGGRNMNPPSADAGGSPRSSSGGKGQAPPAPVGKDRSTPGGKGQTPPSAEVPSSGFVPPKATRQTPTFTPKVVK